MHLDEPRARIAYQGSAMSRAKQLAMKTFMVLGGTVVLAGTGSLAFGVNEAGESRLDDPP